MSTRQPARAGASPVGEVRASCITRWRSIADTETVSALADIIFTAVSSVYVNDRPAPSMIDRDQETAAL